jgi:hypothetical protein
MGASNITGLGFSQVPTVKDPPISEFVGSTSAFGAVTPEPNDLDSDEIWVAMLKKQHQVATRQGSIWQLFHDVDKTDPRRDEVRDADWRGFLEFLRKSYAKRADTLFWSMIVFSLAAAILIPFLGFLVGPALACLVSLCWTVVHRVRRL